MAIDKDSTKEEIKFEAKQSHNYSDETLVIPLFEIDYKIDEIYDEFGKTIEKQKDGFNYKIARLLESLEDSEESFNDKEFYKNLLKDIQNLKVQ